MWDINNYPTTISANGGKNSKTSILETESMLTQTLTWKIFLNL